MKSLSKTLLLLPSAWLLASCTNRVTCTPGPPQLPFHTPGAATWLSSDGKKRLPIIEELPPHGRRTKSVVIMVPGMDGTLGDYQSLTRALARHGYAVHGYEQRTMKYDPDVQARGTASDWRPWVRDLVKFTADVRRQHPGVPLYYHGHSFGAVVALETTHEEDCSASKHSRGPDGLILQSPAFAMLPASNPWLINSLLWPVSGVRLAHLRKMEKRDLQMTRNERWNCAWMRSDDRVEESYTFGWLRQVWKMGHQARIFSESGTIPPTLVLRGEQDFITLGGRPGQAFAQKPGDYEAYVDCFRMKPNARRVYPEGRHLLTESDGKGEVIRDILAWLDARHQATQKMTDVRK